ncbi:serine/threonine-protein kinase Nek3 [Ctenodactylus gundi]
MDDYVVLRVIGEGSFGRALLVQQESSNQTLAMKEIRLPKSFSDRQNSRREAVLLAKMKHPNIVAFKESFEAEGHLYIVMEYCDGGDLMQKIKQQKGKLFPENMILNWFTQMCLGVNHIHRKRVLHRDIKSKNVFLTHSGRVKLGDFGSARLLASPMAFACTYVGTPYYVPPEIWENLPYNNKSDIWSLGCILYELCTLKHPFHANSWKNLILKICQGAIQPLPSHYTYELQCLVKQMFKRSPSQRPSATTLLSRGSMARLVQKCLSPEIITEYGKQILDETKIHKQNTPRKQADPSRIRAAMGNEASTMQQEEQGRKYSSPDLESTNTISAENALRGTRGKKESGEQSAHPRKPSSPSPHRRQWEKNVSRTTLTALENASILTSSLMAEDDRGGSVVKYSENNPRREWLRETPDTLLDILKNADLSLAFQTYTIYRPGAEGFLKGPLSEDTEVSDSVDGGDESIVVDPERLEPRLDEEDTDFEEEDENPGWMSELKKRVERQGVCDGNARGCVPGRALPGGGIAEAGDSRGSGLDPGSAPQRREHDREHASCVGPLVGLRGLRSRESVREVPAVVGAGSCGVLRQGFPTEAAGAGRNPASASRRPAPSRPLARLRPPEARLPGNRSGRCCFARRASQQVRGDGRPVPPRAAGARSTGWGLREGSRRSRGRWTPSWAQRRRAAAAATPARRPLARRFPGGPGGGAPPLGLRATPAPPGRESGARSVSRAGHLEARFCALLSQNWALRVRSLARRTGGTLPLP